MCFAATYFELVVFDGICGILDDFADLSLKFFRPVKFTISYSFDWKAGCTLNFLWLGACEHAPYETTMLSSMLNLVPVPEGALTSGLSVECALALSSRFPSLYRFFRV